jgi:hypothetical protein
MAEQQSKLGYVAIATALITSVPALVTSIAAFRRPADTAPAKAVYEQLAKDVRELSDQNRRNHEDLVAMRNYLDGYLRGTRKPRVRPDKDGDGIPEADAGAPTPKATGKGSGGGNTDAVELSPPAPPPPRLSPAPAPVAPPGVEDLF